MADGLHDVGLSDPRRAGDKKILLLFGETARCQITDERRGERLLVETIVEPLEGLLDTEARGMDSFFKIVVVAVCDLILHEKREELVVAEIVLAGLPGPDFCRYWAGRE